MYAVPIEKMFMRTKPFIMRRRLVAQGLYRYSRNPMSLGVFLLVLGEALITHSAHLMYYLQLVLAVQLVHVARSEKRWLCSGFGAQYEQYCNHVPRWLLRI